VEFGLQPFRGRRPKEGEPTLKAPKKPAVQPAAPEPQLLKATDPED
jgi:hypothetical protein